MTTKDALKVTAFGLITIPAMISMGFIYFRHLLRDIKGSIVTKAHEFNQNQSDKRYFKQLDQRKTFHRSELIQDIEGFHEVMK